MAITGGRDKQTDREIMVADYSRKKLLTYADSFRELADSFFHEYNAEGEDRQQVLEKRRLWEKQQVLCANMTEMSKILSQVAVEAFRFHALPERLEKKIVRALRMEKIIVTDIYYIQEPKQGGSEPDMPGADLEGVGQDVTTAGRNLSEGSHGISLGISMYTEKPGGYTAAEVSGMLSVLLDNRLSVAVTSPYAVDKEEKSYIFVEEPPLMVLPGYAKAVKENETVSGDNYAIIESVRGKLTVFLSDGMGSGEKASRDSEKVLDLMEKLLEAGYDIDTAMSLLNSALAVSEEEQNMSTLDVVSLDLYSGMCQFRKAGAAATFLKSNTYVEQIVMNTLPLGIFRETQAKPLTRELIENDYVIMVTDGVTDALSVGGYEDMLQSYIEDLQETNPGEMARKILQFALRCSGGRIPDDMTVVVLGVFRGR